LEGDEVMRVEPALVPLQQRSRRAPLPFLSCEDIVKDGHLSPDTKSVSASRTVRNKFLFCMNHPFYGILLQQS